MAPKNGWVGKRGAVNVGPEGGHPRVRTVAFGAIRRTAAFVLLVKAWRGAVGGRSYSAFPVCSSAQGSRLRGAGRFPRWGETISGAARPFEQGARRVASAKLAPFATIFLAEKLGQVTRERAS